MNEIEIIKTETATAKWPTELPDTSHLSLYDVPGYGKGPTRLIVEIRSEGKITDHATRSWCCVSQATMGLAEAKALRDGLDNWIEIQETGEQTATPDLRKTVKTAELLRRLLGKGE